MRVLTYGGWNLDDIQIKGYQSPIFLGLDGGTIRKQNGYSGITATGQRWFERGGLGGDDTDRALPYLQMGKLPNSVR